MKTKFEFKEDAFVSSDDPWYDLTDGGYIKPEDLLVDQKQAKMVADAVKLLRDFMRQLEDNEILEIR